ncbi:hypothetical protein LL965_12395 [Xanthomonas cassavae CFBP 4642]|uniref:Uncharacterized protein n=1 Tax=Xanthomonas cassavae CFBP 4642 TaxID=1219375 RepID=A0ABS8HFA0_9XANT|nr:hypothetical protein [Xanthomonas cassavae CFBP 4642]
MNALGVEAGPAQALLGRADSLGQSQVNSAQFDLADPRARAAMDAFVRAGTIAPGVPGVDEMQTLERINFSSQQRLQLELGPLSANVAGDRNQGSQVRISTPREDGRSVVQQLHYGDNVPLTIVRQYDGNDAERTEQRSYRFEIERDVAAPGLLQRLGGRNEASEEKAIAQTLNSALSGEMTGTGAIAPGQKTTLEFSEVQMQALLEQTRASADASKIGGSALTSLVGDRNAPAQSPEQFAIAIARNVGGSPYAFAERLQHIADGADGNYDGQLQRIDATVLPRPTDAPRRSRTGAMQRTGIMPCCSNARRQWSACTRHPAPRPGWMANAWPWARWWPHANMACSGSITCCSATILRVVSWCRERSTRQRICGPASMPRLCGRRPWRPACSACRRWIPARSDAIARARAQETQQETQRQGQAR